MPGQDLGRPGAARGASSAVNERTSRAPWSHADDSEWRRDLAELRRVHQPLLSAYRGPRCRGCEQEWPCYGARLAEQPKSPWDGWLSGDDYEQAAALRREY
jgi:hypothetical protein